MEAAVSALVGAAMVAMAIYAGPSLWTGAVPEPVRLAVSPYLQPLFSVNPRPAPSRLD